ncbi:MAG: hypothetical protein ACK5Z4_15290 [Planctomyces sp.]
MRPSIRWMADIGLGALRVRAGAAGGDSALAAPGEFHGPTADERRAVLAQMHGRPLRWGVSGFWGLIVSAVGIGISAVLAAVVGARVFLDMAWAAQRNDGSMFGGLFVGEKAIITLLLPSAASMWDGWQSDLSIALERAPGSYAVVAGVVGLVMLFVFVLVWCRLGARACLARRRWCVKCAHDLTGQPIVGTPEQDAVLAVRCSECGTMQAVVRGWGEVRPQSRAVAEVGDAGTARLVYSPASGLVWRLWTRRRAMWAGAAIGAIAVVGGAIWGIREVRVRAWIDREVAAARAAVLTDEQLEAIVNEGRAEVEVPQVPEARAGEEDRRAAVRRLNEELRVAYGKASSLPGVASIMGLWPTELFLLQTQAEREKYKQEDRLVPAQLEREMFEVIRLTGVRDAVAMLPEYPMPARVITDFDDGKLEAAGVVKAALMFMREAGIRGDLAEFRRQSLTAVAALELMSQESFLSQHLIARGHAGWLCTHLDWIARTRPEREWLEVASDIAARIPRADLERVMRNEAVFSRNEMAKLMSDPQAVRDGLAETVAQGDEYGARAFFGVPREAARRMSFEQNSAAMAAFAEDCIALLEVMPWIKRAERREQLRARRPEVYSSESVSMVESVWNFVMNAEIKAGMSARSLRVSIRLEYFRLDHGRLPTEAEFAAMFANDPDAQDPFVGGLLRYRVQEETERTVDPDARSPRGMPVLKRGYVLYSVGPDGVDDGGTKPLEDWRMRDVEGLDVVLP